MRGRPVKSEIRQNVIDILAVLGRGYGYEIFKIYQKIFPKCTREVIYYHLKKGVDLEEFKIEQVKTESGNYSWGRVAEKTYYVLGKNAQPKKSKRIEKHLKKGSSKD